jgi:hypothetical protein
MALQSGILVFLVLDVLTHTAQQNPSIPTSAFATGLWQEQGQVLTPKLGESRAMISPAAEKHLLRNSIRNPLEEFVGKRLALWSNLNLLDEIPKVNGSSTLQLREQKQVEALLYNETNQLPSGLIRFLGVSQLTASNSMVEWSARTNYCPMVTCGQKPIFEAATNILPALFAPEFEPREVVYLPIEARSSVIVSNQTGCRIISRRFSMHGLEVETECKEPSLVVISQSFYHPWRAEIDGRSISLWRANYAFQALQVSSGRHLVRLSYRDRNLELGAIVSAVTLAFCLLFWSRNRSAKTNRLEE